MALSLLAPGVALATQVPKPPVSVRAAGIHVSGVSVEGLNRAPAELVVIASRLEPGHAYDEAEIAAAAARVRRLPFVHDVEVRLAPGTERGLYRVVLRVREKERLYFAADLELVELGDALRLDPTDEAESSELGADLAAGARWFPGGDSMLTVGWAAGALEVGLSSYDLGGSGLVGSVSLSHHPAASQRAFELGLDPALSAWRFDSATQVRLGLGRPLAANQLLTGSVSLFEADDTVRGAITGGAVLGSKDTRQLRAELAWVLDTTDDPLLARRGRVVRAGLRAATLETSTAIGVIAPDPGVDSRLVSAHLSLRQHWPLGPRSTASLALSGSIGRADVDEVVVGHDAADPGDLDVMSGQIELTLASDLWLPQFARRRGDLRWEARAGFGRERLSPLVGAGSVDRFELSLGVLFRNEWGAIRIAFTYLDLSVGRESTRGAT